MILPQPLADIPGFAKAAAFWHSLKDGRMIPERAALKLTSPALDAGNLLLIDVIADDNWRIKYQGADMLERARKDTVGVNMFAHIPLIWRADYIDVANLLRRMPAASHTTFIKYVDHGEMRLDALSFPLMDATGTPRFVMNVTHMSGVSDTGYSSIQLMMEADELSVGALDIGFGVPFEQRLIRAGVRLPSPALSRIVKENITLMTAWAYLERLRPDNELLPLSRVNLVRLDQLGLDWSLMDLKSGGYRFTRASRTVTERMQTDITGRDFEEFLNPAMAVGLKQASRELVAARSCCVVRYVANLDGQPSSHLSFMYYLSSDDGETDYALSISTVEQDLPRGRPTSDVHRNAHLIEIDAVDIGFGVPWAHHEIRLPVPTKGQ